MMPPAYVKPYIRRQKNDASDASAICEAVTRPAAMWAKRLIEKKPFKLVAVALANKMARIAFAIMCGTTVYREIPA